MGIAILKQYDILIIGGGLVGCSLALALAQKTSLKVCILEANSSFISWSATKQYHRVSAITLQSKQFLQKLDVWDGIQKKRFSAFHQIQIFNTKGQDVIEFKSEEMAAPALGFIIENNLIQTELMQKIKQFPQIEWVSPIVLNTFYENENAVVVTSQEGQEFHAQLAVAADGTNSWLRGQAGIACIKKDYQEEALVTTVTTSLAHGNTARQIFLPSGPLAFLPLADQHTSSIVWTLPSEKAKELKTLDENLFKQKLAHAFVQRLGEITSIDQRHAFPLIKQTSENYIRSRVILVGDAAHTIHPLAGQGVNLGLQDAAFLADLLKEVKQPNLASLKILRRYERSRRAENAMMMKGIDIIKYLFQNQQKPIQSLLSFGLKTTNHSSWIKKRLMQYAVGGR